jgi:hypothetical protein
MALRAGPLMRVIVDLPLSRRAGTMMNSFPDIMLSRRAGALMPMQVVIVTGVNGEEEVGGVVSGTKTTGSTVLGEF